MYIYIYLYHIDIYIYNIYIYISLYIYISIKDSTIFVLYFNLLSLLLKLPQLIKIGTDLQFCIFCWPAIVFLIVVIENHRRIG